MNEFIFNKSFKRSGVYAIRCKQTNKYYIGSAGNIYGRLKQHFMNLKAARHHNHRIQQDFNAGYDFECSIIQEFNNQEPQQIMIAIEYLYILELYKKGLQLYNTEVYPRKDQEPEKFIINCILGRLRNLYDIEFNSYYFNYIESKKGD